MNRTVIGGMVVSLMIAAAPASAGPDGRHHGYAAVDQRMHNQKARIEHAWQSGRLTGSEAHRLQREQAHIRREAHAYMGDGRLSAREWRELQHDQGRASRHIRQQAHDGDRRFAPPSPRASDPGVDQRQFEQNARIRNGWRSGELTPAERGRLLAQQRAIRQQERAYRADGVLTHAERRDLHRDLSAAGRSIYRETHDAEQRY